MYSCLRLSATTVEVLDVDVAILYILFRWKQVWALSMAGALSSYYFEA